MPADPGTTPPDRPLAHAERLEREQGGRPPEPTDVGDPDALLAAAVEAAHVLADVLAAALRVVERRVRAANLIERVEALEAAGRKRQTTEEGDPCRPPPRT